MIRVGVLVSTAVGALWLTGCRSPESYRLEADNAALDIIDRAQEAGLGRVGG